MFAAGTGVHVQAGALLVHHHLQNVAVTTDVEAGLVLVQQFADAGRVPARVATNVGDENA